jgi:hypothetical protein
MSKAAKPARLRDWLFAEARRVTASLTRPRATERATASFAENEGRTTSDRLVYAASSEPDPARREAERREHPAEYVQHQLRDARRLAHAIEWRVNVARANGRQLRYSEAAREVSEGTAALDALLLSPRFDAAWVKEIQRHISDMDGIFPEFEIDGRTRAAVEILIARSADLRGRKRFVEAKEVLALAAPLAALSKELGAATAHDGTPPRTRQLLASAQQSLDDAIGAQGRTNSDRLVYAASSEPDASDDLDRRDAELTRREAEMTRRDSEAAAKDSAFAKRERRLGALALPPARLALLAQRRVDEARANGRSITCTEAMNDVLTDASINFNETRFADLPPRALARQIDARIASASKNDRLLSGARALVELEEEAAVASGTASESTALSVRARRIDDKVSANGGRHSGASYADASREIDEDEVPGASLPPHVLARRARQLIDEAEATGGNLTASAAVNRVLASHQAS